MWLTAKIAVWTTECRQCNKTHVHTVLCLIIGLWIFRRTLPRMDVRQWRDRKVVSVNIEQFYHFSLIHGSSGWTRAANPCRIVSLYLCWLHSAHHHHHHRFLITSLTNSLYSPVSGVSSLSNTVLQEHCQRLSAVPLKDLSGLKQNTFYRLLWMQGIVTSKFFIYGFAS